MTTLSSITFLAGVVLLAACLTGIMQGIADDAEKRRLKRRAKYRCIAYADVYRRRCQSVNRDELWRRFAK